MPPRNDAFYFGCWSSAGHYLVNTHGGSVNSAFEDPAIGAPPWKESEIDCVLQPGCFKDRFGHRKHHEEVEGHAALHYKDGWTALSFWDRSVDRRGGCNSTFMFKGTYDFDTMLALARQHFPSIMGRFTFPIVLAPGQEPLVPDLQQLRDRVAELEKQLAAAPHPDARARPEGLGGDIVAEILARTPTTAVKEIGDALRKNSEG